MLAGFDDVQRRDEPRPSLVMRNHRRDHSQRSCVTGFEQEDRLCVPEHSTGLAPEEFRDAAFPVGL